MLSLEPGVTATVRFDDLGPERWDLIVIGAGPAGAMAARQAALGGARVLLVDRASFPRRKVCGCCLNGAALGVLTDVGLGTLATECQAKDLRGEAGQRWWLCPASFARRRGTFPRAA